MSDLDDKLREILDKFTVKPMPDDKYYRRGQDDIVAQIHQAYQEAGYALHLAENVVVIHHKDVMTGQEWYDKFKKELKTLISRGDGETWMGWDCGEVEEAAKRAAGLDNYISAKQ